MAHRAVHAAVRQRLVDNFTGCPVFEEGQFDAPKDASAFLVLQFPYNSAAQATAGDPGNNWYRENGGIRFVLNVRRKGGVAQGREWADEIAALFRGAHFDGVRTYAPSSPVSDDSSDAAGYLILSFAVEYDFDFLG